MVRLGLSKILVLFIGVMLFSASSPAFAESRCSQFLSGKPTLDIQVVEKNNHPRIIVFKNNTLAGVALNQLVKLLRSPLKLDELAFVMSKLKNNLDSEQAYFPQLASAFELKARYWGEGFDSIPKSKPVIFYANHPLSGADAFAIAAGVQSVRPDLKVVAASYLTGIPGFSENAFIVDNRQSPEAKIYNKKILIKINEHIKNGGALLIFPSGSVSAYVDKTKTVISDVVWKKGILRFAEQNPETVLKPIFVSGEPSKRYLKLRDFSVAISNAYVFRELADQIGSTIDLTFGKNISYSELNLISSDPEVQLNYLRESLYHLKKDR